MSDENKRFKIQNVVKYDEIKALNMKIVLKSLLVFISASLVVIGQLMFNDDSLNMESYNTFMQTILSLGGLAGIIAFGKETIDDIKERIYLKNRKEIELNSPYEDENKLVR